MPNTECFVEFCPTETGIAMHIACEYRAFRDRKDGLKQLLYTVSSAAKDGNENRQLLFNSALTEGICLKKGEGELKISGYVLALFEIHNEWKVVTNAETSALCMGLAHLLIRSSDMMNPDEELIDMEDLPEGFTENRDDYLDHAFSELRRLWELQAEETAYGWRPEKDPSPSSDPAAPESLSEMLFLDGTASVVCASVSEYLSFKVWLIEHHHKYDSSLDCRLWNELRKYIMYDPVSRKAYASHRPSENIDCFLAASIFVGDLEQEY